LVVNARVARDARPEERLFVENPIEVMTQSRDQREVLSPIGLVLVVVHIPDIAQQVLKELFVFIHHVKY
jgi:hypothetical protein